MTCTMTETERDVLSRTRTPANAVMANSAYELISKFYSGVDDVIRDVAERLAAARGSVSPKDPSIVVVEREDVVRAGGLISESLRPLVADGKLPPRLDELIARQADDLAVDY